MPRWYRSIQIPGYPSWFELECAAWERSLAPHTAIAWMRMSDDGITVRLRVWR